MSYTTVEEMRRTLPKGYALCRRCISVGVPDDRYLCNGCVEALNPPAVRRANKEQDMLRKVMRVLLALQAEGAVIRSSLPSNRAG